MPSYKVQDIEKVKEMEFKGEPATILQLTLEEPSGDTTQAEMFTTARTTLPEVGGVVEGTIESSQYGLKFKPVRKGGSGGFQKSPEQEKRIVRQHSQEQAIRVMAILGRVLDEESFVNLIQWFVDDAYGKTKGVNAWPMNSDVPIDKSDLIEAKDLFDPEAA